MAPSYDRQLRMKSTALSTSIPDQSLSMCEMAQEQNRKRMSFSLPKWMHWKLPSSNCSFFRDWTAPDRSKRDRSSPNAAKVQSAVYVIATWL